MRSFLTAPIALLFILTGAPYAHASEVGPEFVGSLVQPYLTIQTALADDNLADAKSGADELAEAVSDDDAIESSWREPVQIIRDAPDIETARRGFKELSHRMLQVVKDAGSTVESPLYLAHCPMAFGGEGGSWIQADETVANPYYGVSMLRCGTVQEQLSGKMGSTHDASRTGHGHDGHDH